MAMINILLSIILSLSLCNLVFANTVNSDFEKKLYSLKWVAYAPTNFNPKTLLYPSDSSMEEDLKVLFNAGFNGIVTYGSEGTLGRIPKIAKELGFQGVIMGIWDIKSQEELDHALTMVDYVDGYCVGNEGLGRRYGLRELKAAMTNVKVATKKPTTTTEELDDYAKQYMLEIGDWIFPTGHPFLANITSAGKAVKWVEYHYRLIRRSAPANEPILFKEIGYPTKGNVMAREKNQRDFFLCMEMSDVKFVYFEAFDQHWKRHLPVEPYWGLFDKNRKPKRFMQLKLSEKKRIN